MIRVDLNPYERKLNRREVERLCNVVSGLLHEHGLYLFQDEPDEDGGYPLAVFERGAMREVQPPYRDTILHALERRKEIRVIEKEHRPYVYPGSTELPRERSKPDALAKHLGHILIAFQEIAQLFTEMKAAPDAEGIREARHVAASHAEAATKAFKAACDDGVAPDRIRAFMPLPDDARAQAWMLNHLPWLAPSEPAKVERARAPSGRAKRRIFGDDLAGHLLDKLRPAALEGRWTSLNQLRKAFAPSKRAQVLAMLTTMVEDGRIVERPIGRIVAYKPADL